MTTGDVVKIVSNFQRASGLDIHDTPIQIDDNFVIKVAKHLTLTGVKIRVVDVRTVNKILFGYIRVYENKVDIGVKENLNPCWTRFVTCKEISHLLIGNNGNGVTNDPKMLINGFYSKLLRGNDDAMDHEHLAMLCAAEIMMPYEISQPLLKDKDTTSIAIAQKFKIPLFIVQVYRGEDMISWRDEKYARLQ